MLLKAYGRQVESIFRLFGADENTLTASLAICLSRSKSLLRKLLCEIGLKNIHGNKLEQAEITYQSHGATHVDGITDLEILVPNCLHVIVEAKIGSSIPGLSQYRKYQSRFNDSVLQNFQRLVTLVDSGDAGKLTYNVRPEPVLHKVITWGWFYKISQQLLRGRSDVTERYFLTQFGYFIDKEYQMKSYEEEVWVVPQAIKPLWEKGLSFYDIALERRIYFHPEKRSRKKAIYFAPRAHGQVEYVQKILSVEYGESPKDYIKELSHIDWASTPHTIFRLGDKVKLPKPVPSGKIWNRVAYVDFDLLTGATTIDDAQKATIKRAKRTS